MATPIDNSKLRFAGDVNIEAVELLSVSGVRLDISAMVKEIQIFEDIFKPCTTGSLAVEDSRDLANIFKFVGEETVRIIIKTPNLPNKPGYKIDRIFVVYKMDDRQMVRDRMIYYKLHFCSPEMIVDSNVKLSKTYNGPIADVVATLVKKEGLKSGAPFVYSKTSNNIKYTSNYWSPYRNIRYLTERAINSNNCANFMFFENANGLNFTSLDDLFSQKPVDTYTYDNFNRESSINSTSSNKNVGKEYVRLISYKVETGFDFLKRNTSGVYASKLITHDITTKKYSTKNYTLFNNFGGEVHLNKFPIGTLEVASRVNSNIYVYPKYNSAFNGFADDSVQKWLQNRVSLMGQLEAFRMNVEIPGRTDLTVGQVITIQLYKVSQISQNDTTKEILDTMFSGNYLITAINHRFISDKHETHMELMKDSLITNAARAT